MVSPKGNIYIEPLQESQGWFWNKEQKDCKSQREWITTWKVSSVLSTTAAHMNPQ